MTLLYKLLKKKYIFVIIKKKNQFYFYIFKKLLRIMESRFWKVSISFLNKYKFIKFLFCYIEKIK